MSDCLNIPLKDYSNNLIAKWVFDDTDTSKVNGSTIYDLSGNGNNLTAYNLSFIDDADMLKVNIEKKKKSDNNAFYF